MGASIEAYDKESVMQMYHLHGRNHWSLWQGGRLVFSTPIKHTPDECERLLTEYLDILDNNGSTAVYSFRIHDKPKTAITNKTDYIGSFNARLYANEGDYERRGPEGIGSTRVPVKYNPLMQEFNDLKNQVELLTKALNNKEEDEPESFPGEKMIRGITGMLDESPALSNMVMGVLEKLGINMGPARQLAGVGGDGQITADKINTAWSSLSQEQQQLINSAVMTLNCLDADFPNVISKLAVLCRDKRGTYDIAKKML